MTWAVALSSFASPLVFYNALDRYQALFAPPV